MQERHYSIKKNQTILQKSLLAAGQFITLFYKLNSPCSQQYFMLAAAHYILALREDLSRRRCKMHLNSCITLLQNLSFENLSPENLSTEDRNPLWHSLLANAYARRAELYEDEDGLEQALNDYLRVLELFDATCLAFENHKTLISNNYPYYLNKQDLNNRDRDRDQNVRSQRLSLDNGQSCLENGINSESDISLEDDFDQQIDRMMLETRLSELTLSITPYIPLGIDRLSIAQTSICVADLLLTRFFPIGQYRYLDLKLKPPMFYLDLAFLNLSKLKNEEDETFMTAAYAYQIAALTVEAHNFSQAISFYHLSLRQIFKASSKAACQTLGDIYNSLGLLYEQHTQNIIIEKPNNIGADHAMIYFATAMFFYPTYIIPENQASNSSIKNKEYDHCDDYPDFNHFYDSQDSLNIIFDSIHRALDPYPYPISLAVLRDFIDALIFAYFCIQDQSLPNQELAIQLKTGVQLDNFAQHIYWLLSEYNRRENRQARLQLFMSENEKKSSVYFQESLYYVLNQPKKTNVIPIKSVIIQA